MTRAIAKVFICAALAISVGLTACRRNSTSSLKGRLILQTRNAIYNVQVSGTDRAKESLIADQVFSAAVSPDGKSLIYSRWKPNSNPTAGPDDGETLLRDLASGIETRVFPYRVSGLSWSPDGARFSFSHLHKLYVSTVGGDSRLIYSERSKPYTPLFGGSAAPVFAATSDAKWLAPDRFVIQTGGEFESLVHDQNGPNPNETDLVVLSNPAKITEVSDRWFVGAQCSSRTLAILAHAADGELQGDIWDFKINAPLYLMHSPKDLDAGQVTPLPYRNAFFTPRSCQLYSVDSMTSSERATIKLIDPETLKEERSLPVKGTRDILGSLTDSNERSMIIWYARPGGPTEAKQKDWRSYGLSLVDLTSGDETDLLISSNYSSDDLRANLQWLKILAWLPSE